MKTKAQNLVDIRGKLRKFKVPDIDYFTVGEWIREKEAILSRLSANFGSTTVAVRSSAVNEDGKISSQAGVYESILNIPISERDKLISAIEAVIASYGPIPNNNLSDEVIVQQMVVGVLMSGVVFTHDYNTGAPYYVINYDDVSGLTNTVTSGDGIYSNRTIYIHREAFSELRSSRFRSLLEAIRELEMTFESEFIDVEFAIGEDLTPYLFQVRLITTQPNWNRAVAKRIDAELNGIKMFVRNRLQPMTGVYGDTTVLGQMPDWNPAEMIGRAPRSLAYSLYKTLITDQAWSKARELMGYNVPKGQPLMISLAGQPFIDVRLSFHSFIPSGISPEICNKLVNLWVKKLREHPEFHDKVEFEIAITAYSFDFDEKIQKLVGDVLSVDEKLEFKSQLYRLTYSLILDVGEGGITAALNKLKMLTKKQDETKYIKNSIDSLYKIIDDCIEFGTIPFAILARHGFIARTILLSLNRRGILANEEIHELQSNICTIASDLVDEMEKLRKGSISFSSFMEQFGHLRPGTYDILSKSYDEMDFFSTPNGSPLSIKSHSEFKLSDKQQKDINSLLQEEKMFDLNADKLMKYIRVATEGREYGKFIFTKSVSKILEIISDFGDDSNLSLEELSHIPIKNFLDILTESHVDGVEEHLRSISEVEAGRHVISSAIRLPQILFDEEGVHIVPFQVSHPNFITTKKIMASCAYITASGTVSDLREKIVLIENADPGFDWIFSQKIGGLITKFGGANSHMAIRCAEFGIPAAIGCGEQRFEVLVSANQIHLDCASGFINLIH